MASERENAETTALRALAWIAADEALLPAFLAATGASPADLRARLAEPAFLGAVLDFILRDDATVTAFCDAERLRYEAPMEARRRLPGGDQTHWT